MTRLGRCRPELCTVRGAIYSARPSTARRTLLLLNPEFYLTFPQMMPPMSDWFRSVPHGLDALASAAKFQQNNMASLVRFYKHKCSQQRAAMNKIGNTAAQIQALQKCVAPTFLSLSPFESSRIPTSIFQPSRATPTRQRATSRWCLPAGKPAIHPAISVCS